VRMGGLLVIRGLTHFPRWAIDRGRPEAGLSVGVYLNSLAAHVYPVYDYTTLYDTLFQVPAHLCLLPRVLNLLAMPSLSGREHSEGTGPIRPGKTATSSLEKDYTARLTYHQKCFMH
jgi:hypothetical protein